MRQNSVYRKAYQTVRTEWIDGASSTLVTMSKTAVVFTTMVATGATEASARARVNERLQQVLHFLLQQHRADSVH